MASSGHRLQNVRSVVSSRAKSTAPTTWILSQKKQSVNFALFGASVLAFGGAMLYFPTTSADSGSVDYLQVRKDIAELLDQEDWDDGSIGPVLVRLAWHASGSYDAKSNTGGSNGATMRFTPEINHGGNAGLHLAQKMLEPIKRKHPNVSYADLWVLASYVAIEEMGGPSIEFSPGRVDSSDATHPDDKEPTPDGRLPDGDKGAQHVRDIFYRMGFNDREIVCLSGAHSLGRCHADRSGFIGPWTRAPTTFSNLYYQMLFDEEWVPINNAKGQPQYENKNGKDLMMLESDMAIVRDPKFRKYARMYADDEELFARDFAKAFKKLTELGCNLAPSWKKYAFSASRH